MVFSGTIDVAISFFLEIMRHNQFCYAVYFKFPWHDHSVRRGRYESLPSRIMHIRNVCNGFYFKTSLYFVQLNRCACLFLATLLPWKHDVGFWKIFTLFFHKFSPLPVIVFHHIKMALYTFLFKAVINLQW